MFGWRWYQELMEVYMTNTKLIQRAVEDIHAKVVVHHSVSVTDRTVTLYYFDSDEPTAPMKKHDISVNINEYRESYSQPIKHGPSWNFELVERTQSYPSYALNRLHSATIHAIGNKVRPQPAHEYAFIETVATRRMIYKLMVQSRKFKYSDYINCANLARHINPKAKIISSRYNDNLNKHTFDSILVSLTVNCCERTRRDMSQYIQFRSSEITRFVWNLLENSGEFKKYNVPINFVKIRDVIFTRDNRLEYIFILKGESKDVLE